MLSVDAHIHTCTTPPLLPFLMKSATSFVLPLYFGSFSSRPQSALNSLNRLSRFEGSVGTGGVDGVLLVEGPATLTAAVLAEDLAVKKKQLSAAVAIKALV